MHCSSTSLPGALSQTARLFASDRWAHLHADQPAVTASCSTNTWQMRQNLKDALHIRIIPGLAVGQNLMWLWQVLLRPALGLSQPLLCRLLLRCTAGSLLMYQLAF